MQPLGHEFYWYPLGDRLAIMLDPFARNGWSRTTYLGFETKKKAELFLSYALKRCPIDCELRKAERLTHCTWELKIRDMDPTLQDAVIHKEATRQTTAESAIAA